MLISAMGEARCFCSIKVYHFYKINKIQYLGDFNAFISGINSTLSFHFFSDVIIEEPWTESIFLTEVAFLKQYNHLKEIRPRISTA